MSHPDYFNHPGHADHNPKLDPRFQPHQHTMKTDEYTTLTNELATYTSLSNEMAALEANFQKAITELIAECYREDFAETQDALSASEARIEALALKHPEWFAKTKTLKTPFGTVASRSTTKLNVPNEEATIALLELRGAAAEPFLRVRKYLSLESLEALDDAELMKLKLARVTTEKITITPAKVDLGKAIAKTDGKEAKAS